MSRDWRFWLFAVFAVAFVLGIDRITAHPSSDHHQDQGGSPPKNAAQPRSDTTANNSQETARFVPLYAEGDLHVRKTVNLKKKKISKKDRKSQRKQAKSTNKKARRTTKVPPVTTASKLTGDRPVLEVAYKDIGFSRYLDVIERVGRLFVLVETEKGSRLGPEISLKRRLLYRQSSDLNVLAVKRPHLVSDGRIRDRLATIKIPDEAYDDSVVLILTKPFDDLLWDTIEAALRKRQLGLHQVSQIVGDYTEETNGVFLQFDSAVIKGTGKMVRLNQKLRVSL
jgi:hypothetical protein